MSNDRGVMIRNERKRKALFALTELLSLAAECHRDFVVSDGDVRPLRGHLADLERTVATLRSLDPGPGDPS